MATIDLGKIAPVYKGTYAPGTYNKYEVVFNGESSFISLKDNNVTALANDGINWQYLCRGSYVASIALNNRINDLVIEIDNADEALSDRIDNLVIGSGTSSAEVIEARGNYATLRARLDDQDYTLRNIAWGQELMEGQTSTDWSAGRVGNLTMFAEYEALCGRYMLLNNGYMAKLNPSDSSIFADGTPLSDADVTSKNGNIMYYAPKLYYLVKTDSITGKKYLWMSMLPIGGHELPACCIGAYKGSMAGTALVSRAGVAPAGAKTISAFWAAAQLNGSAFGLTNYDHQRRMMMKALAKYADTNIQTKLGYGVCGSVEIDLGAQAFVLLTGATKTLGDGYGNIGITLTGGTDCSRVNLGGIEDPYGWQWEMIQNVYFGSSANTPNQAGKEIYIYEGNRMPITAELATHPAGAYRQLVRRTDEGYISSMLLGEFFDLFAKTFVGGGSTSYWSDYSYGNATGQILLFGGNSNYGTYSGLGFARSNFDFSILSADFGARLAYYGECKFTSGSALMAM